MCAAGSLNANSFGYPALLLKMINFLLAGIWLILNYTDNQAYDYPLIKKKYSLLLILTPFLFAEMIIQTNYFLRLKPDIITSCCGTLFSSGSSNLVSEISAFPTLPMKVIFFLGVALTVASGLFYTLRQKGGYLFSSLSTMTFLISILSIISFASLYYYELPTHHCPFCILQKEYGYIGYPLYLALLGGTISGIGVGVLMPCKNIESLSEIVPSLQRRLAILTLVLFTLFTAMITSRMLFSDLILEGY